VNEHIVIRQLLNEALKKRHKSMIKRAADLGIAYANKIMSADRFRDSVLVGTELVHLLEGTDLREECVEAAGIHGQALRMVGKRDEAVRVLQRALEQGEDFLSNETKASYLLAIALAHETERKPADAA